MTNILTPRRHSPARWLPHVLGIALVFGGVLRAEVRLTDKAAAGDFLLYADGRAPVIVVEANANPAVKRVAGDLALDVERVTGVKPAVVNELPAAATSVVFIGEAGHSARLDALASAGKFDLSSLLNLWEARVVQVVENPWPGIGRALVIAGSDRRGTAYGVYDVSEAIGVSPWYWWADVPTIKRTAIAISAGTYREGPPAVKFRGIFLNDEDWGLQPWAAKTLEPETGDIGPKTYARIFELLLRLRANFCWPAMHPCTHAFNYYPDNKFVADNYGIVMGSSHAEPMLRDNVDEWHRDGQGEYDYVTNRAGVLKYWDDRLRTNGRFENVYTVGMRGIHDSGMPGGGTPDEKAQRLQQIISDQRDLLRNRVNPDPAAVPQIFCPYKEVLDLYHRMTQPLPDDISLVWPDDNYGYVRQFSNEVEQRRRGGAGVYYHISYWGRPYDYLWLCSTPPALIWEEMTKAYDFGAKTLWVVNVGDLKPAEFSTEFFLKLAWNPERWRPETIQDDFLRESAGRDFGRDNAPEIAAMLSEYYRLNFSRRPEHLGLDAKQPFLAKPVFSLDAASGEARQRLQDFESLVARADLLGRKLAPELRDAYFELVLYPIRAAALANERGINLGHYIQARQQGRSDARLFYDRAAAAHASIQRETAYYNEQLAGGKWRYIMSAAPRDQAVFEFPRFEEPVGSSPSHPRGPPTTDVSATARDEDPRASKAADFTEVDGRVVIEAEHASARTSGKDAEWRTLRGVGYNGASVMIVPTTAKPKKSIAEIRSESPRLEYKVWLRAPGQLVASVRTLPTWGLQAGQPPRFAISLDDAPPEIISLPIYTDEYNPTWQRDVLRNAAITTGKLRAETAGLHTLKIWMVDPGVVIDSLLLDRRDRAPDYLWPRETRVSR